MTTHILKHSITEPRTRWLIELVIQHYQLQLLKLCSFLQIDQSLRQSLTSEFLFDLFSDLLLYFGGSSFHRQTHWHSGVEILRCIDPSNDSSCSEPAGTQSHSSGLSPLASHLPWASADMLRVLFSQSTSYCVSCVTS